MDYLIKNNITENIKQEKKINENSEKMLAVLLSLLLIFQISSVGFASAVDSGNQTHPIYKNSLTGSYSKEMTKTDITKINCKEATSESIKTEPVISGEEISLRSEYAKHFRTESGTYIAASYNEPIHYSVNGKWEAVDNTPVKTENGKYIVSKTSTPISFPADIRNDYITISNGDGLIAFRLDKKAAENNLSDKSASIKVETKEQTNSGESEYKKAISVDTKHSTLTYDNIFKNGYLEHAISSSVLKKYYY